MGFKIRDLLDGLDGEALKRLCDIRGVGGRSLDDRREALARSYRGDSDVFLDNLRKKDLVYLLATDTTFIDDTEYYLPYASSYAVDELVRIAKKAFFRDGVPSEFEALDEDDEEDEQDDEDDDLDDDGDDEDWDLDEDDYDVDDPRGHQHAERLRRELTFSPEEAASKRAHPYQVDAERVLLGCLGPERPQLLHLATGGGKTLVANNVIARWLERHGGPVFWVTKDWRLLLQAARDLRRRHETVNMPTRLGGDGKVLHPLLEAGPGTAGVVYSTIHTLLRRLDDGALPTFRPTLLVWDESHWGEHSGTGHIVTACAKSRTPVLGLTATPRHDTRYNVAFSRTYHQLVSGGFLAKEVVYEEQTGVAWTPERQRLGDRGFGDVTQASLNELARDKRRNDLIVRHHLEHVRDRQYGKAIVFACSVEHATKLAELFLSRGVAARPVHHQQTDSDVQRSLDMFRTGQVQVLVNVAMLTHGIDVPDARSVFLCRPTTSDILFAQMIGRACRRDEATGKTTFNVVEFTDNVSLFGNLFQSSKKFFQGAGGVRSQDEPRSRPGPGPRPTRHAFDPTGASTWIPDREGVPEAQRGLWYRQRQTFGVEIELTAEGPVPNEPDREWRRRAEGLRERLAATLFGRVAPAVTADYQGAGGDKDNSVWNVEFDGSAGWEVTSRVLSDIEGFTELDEACRAIDQAAGDLGLVVNYRTGLHVHLGWLGRNVEELKRAVRLAKIFEPALATLVAPSRVARFEGGTYDLSAPNEFCRPVSSVFSQGRLARLQTQGDFMEVSDDHEARYVTLNIKPLDVIQTVEVRMHSGTIEARKILPWLSLWMQILWAAANCPDVPEVGDRSVIVPDGDIVALALRYLPDGRQPEQQAFLRRIAARRAEVVQQWARHPNLRPWLDYAMRWTFVPGGVDES